MISYMIVIMSKGWQTDNAQMTYVSWLQVDGKKWPWLWARLNKCSILDKVCLDKFLVGAYKSHHLSHLLGIQVVLDKLFFEFHDLQDFHLGKGNRS